MLQRSWYLFLFWVPAPVLIVAASGGLQLILAGLAGLGLFFAGKELAREAATAGSKIFLARLEARPNMSIDPPEETG